MYFGGYWLIGHEGLDESTPGWAEAGIHVAEIAAALTIMSAHSRLARAQAAAPRTVAGWSRRLYALALGVAWFFMSGKPDF